MHIQGVEEQFKFCVQQRVLMQLSTVSEVFSIIFCRKLSKKSSLTFVDFFKNFFKVAQTIKKIWMADSHWIAWRDPFGAFEGTLARSNVVSPRYSSDIEPFFQFFLSFAKIYDFHHPEITVALDKPHQLLSAHLTSASRKFLFEFSGRNDRENQPFWEDFLFPDSPFSVNRNFQLLEPRSAETKFANHWMVLVDFSYDRVFFFCYILFQARTVTRSCAYISWLLST